MTVFTQASKALLFITASSLLLACGGENEAKKATGGTDVALETFEQRLGYVLGESAGKQMINIGGDFDVDAFVAAVEDKKKGNAPRLSEEEMRSTIAEIQSRITAKKESEKRKATEKNKAEGKAYLAANAAKPGVQTTASGLQYKEITAGTGATPSENDRVIVHYRGTHLNGDVFDSSYDRGQPATFGVTQVIAGWTEALQLMNVGDKFELAIPYNLAYGDHGSRSIGPAATLLFEVELVGIEE